MNSNWGVLRVGNDAKPVFWSLEVSNIPLKSGSILPRGQNDHITRLWRRYVCRKLWKSWPTRRVWSEGDAIAWLVARIRRAVLIHRTQKVYRCTIFRLRKIHSKNGQNSSVDTGRISSLRRHRACVQFTSRRAVLNRGPQCSQGRVQIFRNLKDALVRDQYLQGTQWFPILLPKVPENEERWVHCCIILLFSTSHARFHSFKYIDCNELFVAKRIA